jgi:hypothetical protein
MVCRLEYLSALEDYMWWRLLGALYPRFGGQVHELCQSVAMAWQIAFLMIGSNPAR